ncbi:hypothetical protein OSTOST_00748 [Ostertagia ostertagi]
MDTSTMLSMFKQVLEEQRNATSSMMTSMISSIMKEQREATSSMMKEQKDIMAKIIDRVPQPGQAGTKPEESVALPNVMAALSNRIEKFVFDPDADMSFSKWFSRYKEVFSEDAKQLTEVNKVRLLCEKLDSITFEKYQRHVLPKDVSQIGFDETIQALKQLFDYKTSLFTTRYQCLKLEKSDAEDYLTWNQMSPMDFGLKSQQEAEIRQRLIAILDREHKAGRSVSLHELHQECENFLSLRRDSEIVAGSTKIVDATTVQKRNEIECWNCGGNHYARLCKSKPWFCKKCRKTGHKEKFCDILRQKKPDGQEENMKKMRNSNREGNGRRKAPRRQVRTVEIANAVLEANLNNYDVKFLLDTGSDITLLNEKTWKKMGSPVLERTNVVVKNASGEHMKINGKLRCKIKMKGVETEGYAYVTPYNSLMGLEWIRANVEMRYHLEMMTAEPSEETLNVILQAYRTTPNDNLNNRTPAEVFLGRKLRTRLSLLLPIENSPTPPSEVNRKKMIEQFNRRNNAVPKEFEVGEAVYAQIWKAPQFIWKEGIIIRRIGKVNYEVDLNGRVAKKHANQLRRRNAKAPYSYEDKSLLTLIETLELDDVWKRREETTRPTDAAAPERQTQADVPLRRSKRIRRPVHRYPDTLR